MAGDQTVILGAFDDAGVVSRYYVFEAVGDIEVTDSVELSTEPGVMGRIGPRFPRTASFRMRLHDNDPNTPDYPTARSQHFLLRSFIGQLLYLYARASPPEKIVWTLENVKAGDDNGAKNAFDCEVTAREIIGGDFGEFELFTEKGLVPVQVPDPDPKLTDIGKTDFELQFKEALLEPDKFRGIREVAASNVFVRANENAIANITATGKAIGRILDLLDSKLSSNPNHLRVFGAPLPKVPGCTHVKLHGTLLGVQLALDIDLTLALKYIRLSVTPPSIVTKPAAGVTATAVPLATVYTMGGNTPTFIPVLFKEEIPPENRNTSLAKFPERMDAIIVLQGDVEFTGANLGDYTLIVFAVGGVA